jgi:tetratricopeptide (TPR) repeat protein
MPSGSSSCSVALSGATIIFDTYQLLMGWDILMMGQCRLLRVALIVIGMMACCCAPRAQAQNADDLVSLRSQLSQLRSQGKFAEALQLAERNVALTRAKHGEDHAEFATANLWLALLYQDQGRYREAEPLFKGSLALREKVLGPEHPDVGTSLNNLALLYVVQGRFSDAEPLYKRSLAIAEKSVGLDHPIVGNALNNIAGLYRSQGRYADAETLYKRSLSIREKALGLDHPDVAQSLNNLAGLYERLGRLAEAEPLYQRGLAIREKALGPGHPIVGTVLNNVAELYRAQGRFSEAEPLHKRAFAIREKALGVDHPDVAQSLNNLALLYRAQGRYGEAEATYRRSLAIHEKALGREHPLVGLTVHNLAALAFAQRDWARAAGYWRRSTAIIAARAQRGTSDVGRALTGQRRGQAEQLSEQFWGLVKATHRIALQGSKADAGLAQEMFHTAQWARASEAAVSMAQMAARGVKGDSVLAALVRERQDLVVEWQRRDGARTAAAGTQSDKRDRAAEAGNATRMESIDSRIGDIDKRLAADFPEYAALSQPVSLSTEEVQAQLGVNEALVLFLDTPQWQSTPEETFIWVVTKTEVRWVRSELGTAALIREVSALRCGLDASAWDADGTKCTELPKLAVRSENGLLPFDTSRAHTLYKALFGQVEDLIRNKHLLIVPSGALTQLPFQVLVTAAPSQAGDYRAASWFSRRNAISVLPAVSSLKSLRLLARPSSATKPMIGFGNPLLDGDPAARPWEAEWARLARQKQSCAEMSGQQVASLAEKRRSVLPIISQGGRVDVDHLRTQAPLHDTADELCAVANDLKLAPDDILLGARATEKAIKLLSANGLLAQYRAVHFATHGTLAGEISGSTEPGLILTPPREATESDDGYLSASEAAALKLDADWVILSACNTAAGSAEGAEALSGLARAFFYAGARALLVSHWSVDSAATVKLITSALAILTRDKTTGRSEALQLAMIDMIDRGEPHESHPSYWAPFVVVGEGATR